MSADCAMLRQAFYPVDGQVHYLDAHCIWIIKMVANGENKKGKKWTQFSYRVNIRLDLLKLFVRAYFKKNQQDSLRLGVNFIKQFILYA
jgi:hypothetical protein